MDRKEKAKVFKGGEKREICEGNQEKGRINEAEQFSPPLISISSLHTEGTFHAVVDVLCCYE